MTTKEIQQENDREKLYARLRDKEIRKKERRLIVRKIQRMEADIVRMPISLPIDATIASQE
jgi:hypothetical protein